MKLKPTHLLLIGVIKKVIMAIAAIFMLDSCADPRKIEIVSADAYELVNVTEKGVVMDLTVTVDNGSGAKARIKKGEVLIYESMSSGKIAGHAKIGEAVAPKGESRVTVPVEIDFPEGAYAAGMLLNLMERGHGDIVVSAKIKIRNGWFCKTFRLKKSYISEIEW